MDTDVIVIGAGLAGLVAARELEKAGKRVIVLDKGKSVGGRLASRRIQNGLADHGAQFFTVRTELFQKQVDTWLAEDLIHVWTYGWGDGSLKRTVNDGHPRYVARQGMNHLAKDLAKQLKDVRVNSAVTGIYWEDNHWQVVDNNGLSMSSHALILTPPVPQALDLLTDVPLAKADKYSLERVQYGPCLAGLFVVEGTVNLPEPGAMQDFKEQIYWIADNQAKGISPNECIITLHAEERYSRQHYDSPDTEILSFMRETLQKYMATDAHIKEEQVKRWRYSIPVTTYPHDFLKAQDLPLIFAGDAFGGRGRVEGAYLSGFAAGHAGAEILK